MSWDKPSEELLELLKERLGNTNYELKKMFGQYALFIKGNMFAGVYQSDVFLRLSSELKDFVLGAYEDMNQFEPRPGMVMKEYVIVPESIQTDDNLFSKLLKASIDYVSGLPAKEKIEKREK